MAGKTIRISNKKVEKFISTVREKYDPKAIYLFGSRARGEEMNHSDWDFSVVSEKFEGISFRDRINDLLELVDYPVGRILNRFATPLKSLSTCVTNQPL